MVCITNRLEQLLETKLAGEFEEVRELLLTNRTEIYGRPDDPDADFLERVCNENSVFQLERINQICQFNLSVYETCFFLKALSISSINDLDALIEEVKRRMPALLVYDYDDGISTGVQEKIPSRLLSATPEFENEIIEFLSGDQGYIITGTDLNGNEEFNLFSFLEYMDPLFTHNEEFMQRVIAINSLFFNAAPESIRGNIPIGLNAIVSNREKRQQLNESSDLWDQRLLTCYEMFAPEKSMSRETVLLMKDEEELARRGIVLEIPPVETESEYMDDLPF